ncbi:restriction endonuclease subunit S [Alphaproteobacteria bacterium]|nr:restriction endonuclease subunit S [Alphaproteobacteria bacterium]
MSNASEILSEPVNIVFDIPSNWNRRKLVDLCTPKQWKTISQHEMTKTGYPVFGANGFIGFYPEYNHEYATIAVTCRGATCGTVNLIPEKTYITGNSMCFDNVSIETDVKYLFYATSFRTLSDVISGSAQPQITGESLQFVILPIPPLPEQKKIASILTSVDEVIENTQRQIDKLQELKKATMNELLTKGIGHTEFKDSELGRIPKSWEIGIVADFGNVVTGATPDTSDRSLYDGDFMFVSPSDISEEMFVHATGKTLTDEGISKVRQIPADSIMVVCIGSTIGKVALTTNRCATNQQINSIIPSGADPHFIYFQMKMIENSIRKESGTQAVPIINKSDFASIKIRLPTLDEQKEIGARLSSLNSAISAKHQKLSQTQSLKKSLMQDLLTGKVRVQV